MATSVSVFWRDHKAQHQAEPLTIDPTEWPDTALGLKTLLASKAKKQAQDQCHRVVHSIRFNGTRLSSAQLLAPLEPLLRTDKPRFVAIMETSSMRIYIQLLKANKRVELRVTKANTVKEVKELVQVKEGIAVDQQKLFLGGTRLKDDEILRQCRVQHMDALVLVVSLRGGGPATVPFVDVSDQSAIVRVRFSPTAPDWRVVTRGLNIEGKCLNGLCAAYRSTAICKIGYKPFNVMTEDAHCPLCDGQIKATSCGFYDCEWMYEGMKKTDKTHLSSEWHQATGEFYYTFAKVDGKLVEWNSLVITPRRLPDPGDRQNCSICLQPVTDEDELELVCGHDMHDSCLKQWTYHCTGRSRVATCPICREEVVSF